MNNYIVSILLSCLALAAHAASVPPGDQAVDRWTAENAAPAVSKGGGGNGQTIALGSGSAQTQVRDLFTPDAQHA